MVLEAKTTVKGGQSRVLLNEVSLWCPWIQVVPENERNARHPLWSHGTKIHRRPKIVFGTSQKQLICIDFSNEYKQIWITIYCLLLF